MKEAATYILGTAGHVDHGKTTLIRALTGIETDRLPEEKARGLSIDLGFAHLTLPSGRVAGIVDVPGHERFLKNMLAGVGGFDVVMLVIDAVESVMPQTREHMEILSQLGIKAGVVALTKSDLVDPDFLELAREEITDYLKGTFLEGAPIVPVSGTTGAGLKDLVAALDGVLDRVPPRPSTGPCYLPIDRVFIKTGFGTVITGSLWSGRLAKGDAIRVQPEGLEARVRGVQVHGRQVDAARAGQRVAVNLGGVDAERVRRGQVLSPAAALTPSKRLDARVEVLDKAPHPLRNRSRIRLYMGTEEALGKVVLLEADQIEAGGEGLVQFVLEAPVVARRGDRFVVRNSTAEYTVGGGTFLEVAAESHHRKDDRVLEILRQKGEGQADNLVRAFLLQDAHKPRTVAEVGDVLKVDRPTAEAMLEDLEDRGEVVTLSEGRLVLLASSFGEMEARVRALFASLEEKAPWKSGWKPDEVAKLLVERPSKSTQEILTGMVERGVLKSERGLLSSAGHVPRLQADQENVRDRVLAEVRKNEFTPPGWDDLKVGHGLDNRMWRVLSEYLVDSGEVTFISKDIWFLTGTLDEARRRVVEFIRRNGAITPAQARDVLGTSRKYVIPLLEHFDATHVTKRDGDNRVLFGGRG